MELGLSHQDFLELQVCFMEIFRLLIYLFAIVNYLLQKELLNLKEFRQFEGGGVSTQGSRYMILHA